MAEMVTLRSPDGRVYRTDVASEINTLTARGYTIDTDTTPSEPPPTPQPVEPTDVDSYDLHDFEVEADETDDY